MSKSFRCGALAQLFLVVVQMMMMTRMAEGHDVLLSVHGSGTTNPSKCFWLIMQQITERSKWPIRLSYRAVGSGTGQKEFIGSTQNGTEFAPDNDFGSGDIPVPSGNYSTLNASGIEFVHLPVFLGAISLFHSVPGIPEGEDVGLNLTACIIAKIFSRKITAWDDAEILSLNPNLDASGSHPITVAHRVLGSSSTSSVTAYLHATCPDEWPSNLVGSIIEWPEGTKPCEGSAGMTQCILDVPGTIGYIDSGHGHQEGLLEIELQNFAGNYFSSKKAGHAGVVASAEEAIFPSRADADFGTVNLLNQPGVNTWPIVVMTYVYVRKDLSHIHSPEEQTLLIAFLKSLYDPNYIDQCINLFRFTAIPDTLKDLGLAGIEMLQPNSTAPEWIFETVTQPSVGQGDYVISANRRDWTEYQSSVVEGNVTDLQVQLASMQSVITSLTGEIETLRQAVNSQGGQQVPSSALDGYSEFTDDDEQQLTAALTMSALSITFWGIAIARMVAMFVLGRRAAKHQNVVV